MQTSLKSAAITAQIGLMIALSLLAAYPAAAHDGADHSAPLTASAEVEAETTSKISLTGQLIELSSTDLPTTIVVRQNPGGEFKDFTIEVPAGVDLTPNTTSMSDWITGDFLALTGTLNENTGVVTARLLQNVSLNPFQQSSLNGWVTATDAAAGTMTVTWDNRDYVVKVTADTRLVVPPKNPATLADFQVGDRVRLRLNKDKTQASIIVALRRGDEIFLKARTRGFNGELAAIDLAENLLTVKLGKNPSLRPADVNNLVGVEGELLTVSFDENTKFVRKYNGSSNAEELMAGDQLFIVGRVGDDGKIEARLIKDESIFKRGVARRLGKVTSVSTATNTIKVQLVSEPKITLRAQGNSDDETESTDDARKRLLLKARLLNERELNARIEAAQEWTVTYKDSTTFTKDGRTGTEESINVGDYIRVEGVANVLLQTVVAERISLQSSDFRPLKRIRDLKEIVAERIRTAAGKLRAEDIVNKQEPAEAEEEETKADQALEAEAEAELDADAGSVEPVEETA